MKSLPLLSCILRDLDRLGGLVQDVSPDAWADPLRADARAVFLSGLASLRASITAAIDAVLDGRPVPPVRDALAMLRTLRPAVEMIRNRPVGFVDPDAMSVAAAIEKDVRYLIRKRRRVDSDSFLEESGKWLFDARRTVARLRAGRSVFETTSDVVELGRRARELQEDFADDI